MESTRQHPVICICNRHLDGTVEWTKVENSIIHKLNDSKGNFPPNENGTNNRCRHDDNILAINIFERKQIEAKETNRFVQLIDSQKQMIILSRPIPFVYCSKYWPIGILSLLSLHPKVLHFWESEFASVSLFIAAKSSSNSHRYLFAAIAAICKM